MGEIRILRGLLLAFILLGCGMMGRSEQNTKSLKIPEKISVEIPSVLDPTEDVNVSDITQEKIKVDTVEGVATGYFAVKEYITHFLSIVSVMKSNLFLGNHIISDIEKSCQETALNKICNISENSLFLTIEEDTIEKLRVLIPDYFRYWNPNSLIGEKLPFGAIEFIKYDENSSYRYALNMDMTSIMGEFISHKIFHDENQKPLKIIQKIEWSEDQNQIFSSLLINYTEDITSPWTLYYHNTPNENEKMRLNDMYQDKVTLPSTFNRLFHLTRNHTAQTDKVQLNSIKATTSYSNQLVTDKLSSSIELTPTGGLQKLTQRKITSTSDTKINKEEVFDVNGTLLATTYCDSESTECSLYDTSTWYSDAYDDAIFDPITKVHFEELKIEGNLTEGEYLLIPKEYDINSMNIQEILDIRVGEFIVIEASTQGVLYNESYKDKLETLQVLFSQYNTNLADSFSSKKEKAFLLLSNEEKPHLNLWSEE